MRYFVFLIGGLCTEGMELSDLIKDTSGSATMTWKDYTYNDSQRTGPLNNDISEYCKIDQRVHHPYDIN